MAMVTPAETFLFAAPDRGASYIFGATSLPPKDALASFVARHPDARIRVLATARTFPSGSVAQLMASVSNLRRISATPAGQTSAPAPTTRIWGLALYEVTGESEEGVAAAEGLVRALAAGADLDEFELAPAPAPAPEPLHFFFACAEHGRTMYGTSRDPENDSGIARFRKNNAANEVTVYSGETDRLSELSIAIGAVMNYEDCAADPTLVQGFVEPVLRAVLGSSLTGMKTQVYPPGEM